MQAALAYVPPCAQRIRLSVNLYHVQPNVMGGVDYSQMESNLAGCGNLRAVEINLTTEQEGQVVPVGTVKSAEVKDLVRGRMSERLGSMLVMS